MFEDMVGSLYVSGIVPYVVITPEEQSMEELGREELQLLQEIRDELAALNNRIDAQNRELESIENRRKRTVRGRQATLVERMLARYDAASIEFLDHLPYLAKRVYRIYRAGKPKRMPPRASAAQTRAAESSRRSRRA
jgi:hypothetical protein